MFDAFAEKLVAAVQALKVGNGADEGVTIGPLINDDAFQKVSAIVDQATANGATVLAGGAGTEAEGQNFYQPTVLVNVDDSMDVYNEEIFGPIAPLFKFSTEEEAIRLLACQPISTPGTSGVSGGSAKAWITGLSASTRASSLRK